MEAAAILVTTNSNGGSSLPDSKDFWPAALSPPSSGLLGSSSLHAHKLSPSSYRGSSTSPAMLSRSLDPDSSLAGDLSSSSRIDMDEDEDDDFSSLSGGEEACALALADTMFDMDLGDASTTDASSFGGDSEVLKRSHPMSIQTSETRRAL